MHHASNSACVLADKFISTGEAARLLNNSVTAQTINHWANLGQIQIPFIKTNGGHFRVSREAIIGMRDGGKLKRIDKKKLVVTYCRCSTSAKRKIAQGKSSKLRNMPKNRTLIDN
jgi:excisionase family DNA binding protein